MIKQFFGTTSIMADAISKGSVSFLLATSVTDTISIDGITQAGIPGKFDLTPTLDAEFIVDGIVRSVPEIAETPKGVPTPALMVRAVAESAPFAQLDILDLGLTTPPILENGSLISFDIEPSGNIIDNAQIPAKEIFDKGFLYGQEIVLKGDLLILAESVPSGTTTAYATAKALGYRADGLFASSFKDNPTSLKREVVDKALSHITGSSIFEKLSVVSDNMILFVAGFLAAASSRFPIVLGGGTQMSAVLLTLDALMKEGALFREHLNTNNIALMTTGWVYHDEFSDITAILGQLDFVVEGYYSDFHFFEAHSNALKLYDEGEAKEGVGVGAALCYGALKDISEAAIIAKVEIYLGL